MPVVPFPGDDDATETARLAARLREGDAAAQSELVARYRPGLTIILRKRLKDPALADDLCQEVFRIAFEALRAGRLDADEKLGAYLWGIARTLANTERRRDRRRPPTAPADALIDSAARADEELVRRERARLVREAVNALSPRDRAVLGAFYLDDMPKSAICRRLRLSPPQFDLIKWRALKRLRDLLDTRGVPRG